MATQLKRTIQEVKEVLDVYEDLKAEKLSNKGMQAPVKGVRGDQGAAGKSLRYFAR